jgi:Baseplate J-like protein
MQSRTLEEIQTELIIALAKSNSPATDISPGSVLGALVRSLSVVHLEQDNRLLELYKKSNFLTAEGFELDDLASSFGKRRKQGSFSTGKVILTIESGSSIIPTGTVLTELNTGLQFVVVTQTSTNLTSIKEEIVDISSLETGSRNNLIAGTKLSVTSSDLISLPISVSVGNKRTSDGAYCGDLTGGLDFETDDSFRYRIINSINSDNFSTEEGLKQKLLDIDFISNAWVKTTVPGIIEILISSSVEIDQSMKDSVLNYIKPFVASGVIPVLLVNKLNYLDFTVSLKPYPGSSLDALNLQIRKTIDFYLNSLVDNKAFSLIELNSQLSALALYISADLNTDLSDISESNFQLRGLSILYVN